MAGGWAGPRRLALLDAAVIAMAVGIFEAQAHLWTILLQVEELLAVERSAALPGRKKKKGRPSAAEHVTDENWKRPEGADCVHQRAPEGESLPASSQQTYCRMNWTASSYFIPHSMRASATRTGALRGHTAIRRTAQNSGRTQEGPPEAHLPSPATQWTATQQPGSSLNFSFSRFSQSSTIWLEGGAPSSKGQS